MGRLDGKVCAIVGAGQQTGETIGNGRATAERFAQEGATLLLVDRNEEWVTDTLKAVEAIGARASVLVGDVTSEADCRAVADTCVKRYSRIDVLHNNVGIATNDSKVTTLEVEAFDHIMDVNLRGMFMTIKYALPYMIEQKGGVIINISSTASIALRPNTTYKVSKAAVNALTQHVAMENARYGIRANAILPGLIDTPMAVGRRAKLIGASTEEVRRERAEQVPLGFQGTAWDVANAALFLASDEARYISGVLLPVDGGLLQKIGVKIGAGKPEV